MIGVTKAINDTSKNQIRSHLPVGKKTISKKKCVGVTKKCDFPRLCSSISSTNLPQHCSPLQPSPEISLIVDSLPGVFAVEKPTNYVVTNSSTVTENKENISITKASTQNSISPLSIDPSSLFKDLFDCSDDCFTELKNLSNHFVSDETLTPVAKLPQDDNTHKTTSVIVLSEVPTFESEENKLYSSSTQYFSVQSENDSSSPKTPDSSVMEMNLNVKITDSLLESTCESCNNTDLPNLSVVPDTDKENMNGQCVDVTTNSTSPTLHKDSSIVNYVRDSVVQFVQGIKRKLSPRGSWVTPLTSRILKSSSENAPQSDAKRPRKSSPTHHPTTLTAKATTSSTSLLSLSLTSTNSSFSNLEYSSYTPDRFKYFSCNPVNPTRSLPIVRRWERQHNPLHEVVSFNNSSISKSLSSTESSCSITKSINKHQQLGKHERKIFKRYFYSINEIRRIPLNEDNYLELWKSFFS
ncbi:unnamed protein product [Schistosoma turkestanicum]|nr:unnamed protein product [Schistosoma turkestanicum]